MITKMHTLVSLELVLKGSEIPKIYGNLCVYLLPNKLQCVFTFKHIRKSQIFKFCLKLDVHHISTHFQHRLDLDHDILVKICQFVFKCVIKITNG